MTNRKTCGGPIKAGLAPRSTNFMMGVKKNHHFRGTPFAGKKADYPPECRMIDINTGSGNSIMLGGYAWADNAVEKAKLPVGVLKLAVDEANKAVNAAKALAAVVAEEKWDALEAAAAAPAAPTSETYSWALAGKSHAKNLRTLIDAWMKDKEGTTWMKEEEASPSAAAWAEASSGWSVAAATAAWLRADKGAGEMVQRVRELLAAAATAATATEAAAAAAAAAEAKANADALVVSATEVALAVQEAKGVAAAAWVAMVGMVPS